MSEVMNNLSRSATLENELLRETKYWNMNQKAPPPGDRSLSLVV